MRKMTPLPAPDDQGPGCQNRRKVPDDGSDLLPRPRFTMQGAYTTTTTTTTTILLLLLLYLY